MKIDTVNPQGEDSSQARPTGRLLMFSGGRDSTLAALRWAEDGKPMIMATVSSGHLIGIDRVERRLRSLASRLHPETRWIRVRQPDRLGGTPFLSRTCLPCHHAYVVVATGLARSHSVDRIAFGYTAYQSHWPEQTPLAIGSMRSVLARHALALELPVQDVKSKEDAVAELLARGMDPSALEQKCLRQVDNVELAPDELAGQVTLWEGAMERSLTTVETVKFDLLASRTIGSMA